jgi:hypothetical protein
MAASLQNRTEAGTINRRCRTASWNNKPEMVTCAEDLPMPSELVTWGILWIRNRTLLYGQRLKKRPQNAVLLWSPVLSAT